MKSFFWVFLLLYFTKLELFKIFTFFHTFFFFKSKNKNEWKNEKEGRKTVELELGDIEEIYNPLDESKGFWEKCRFEEGRKKNVWVKKQNPAIPPPKLPLS